MYKLLIAGSRSFHDWGRLYPIMDAITSVRQPSLVITGGASGADTYGHQWAEARGFDTQVVPADWATFGKSAGFVRNEQMVRMVGRDGLVVVFYGPQGITAGTAHTERLARQAGCTVRSFNYLAAHAEMGTF